MQRHSHFSRPSTPEDEANESPSALPGNLPPPQPAPASRSVAVMPPLIQRIKERLPLLEFVRRYRDMKASPGTTGEFFGKCISPDHKDDGPSFYVNSHSNVFHCKGCGISGNVVNAYAIVNGMDPYDAKFALGREIGVVNERKMDDASSLLLRQAQRYQWQLERKDDAMQYLLGRGLTEDTIRRWGLGFCWGTELRDAPAEVRKVAEEAGIARKPDSEKPDQPLRSFMAGRITFPIKDRAGRIVAFAGRLVPSETSKFRSNGPKYLNTPETQYFRKSELLYGAHEAHAGISKKGYAAVVEGYMDVIATHQSGANNTVAVMGASANETTFQTLWSMTKRLVFCLDGDSAGDAGALRSVLAAAPTMSDGCEIAVAHLPAGVDPDEYVLQHGAEAFDALCARGTPLSRFVLESRAANHDLSYPEGRARFMQDAKDVAAMFAGAPHVQEQIVTEARAVVAAAVVDVTLEFTGFAESASAKELRDAITLMQRRLESLERKSDAQATATTSPVTSPAATAAVRTQARPR